MTALNENALTKVATVSMVDMKTAGKTALYTVPVGKTFIPVLEVVRNPSATLAGGTDYDFGTGENADTWRQGVDLSTLVAPADYRAIAGADVTKYAVCGAVSVFGIKVITGATEAATATVDVFGYLT
jgi:hypothetical protein